VGGSFDDVAKPTLHVVDRNESKLAGLGAGVGRVAERLGLSFAEAHHAHRRRNPWPRPTC
jgi:hypothetical protein